MSVKRLTPVLLAVVLAAATVAVAPSVQGGTFPGDDGLIVFAADTDSEGPEDPEIWVVRPDGTGRQQLTDNDAKDNSPQWSADGTKIVFVSNRSGADQIWVMDADGANPTQITDDPQLTPFQPTWSPDGTQIAFAADSLEVYVMDADGANIVPLTTGGTSFHPNWAPDGSKIAFVSERNSGRDIWTMNPDGSDQTQISEPGGTVSDEAPCWSPDSARIVFDREGGGSNDIWSMARDGSDLVQLTSTAASIESDDPCYSPEGGRIVLTSTLYEPFTDRLAVMDADGGNLTPIVDDLGRVAAPDWQAVAGPQPTTTTAAPDTPASVAPTPVAPAAQAVRVSPSFTG
jgi:Tol biopolymer transport system component